MKTATEMQFLNDWGAERYQRDITTARVGIIRGAQCLTWTPENTWPEPASTLLIDPDPIVSLEDGRYEVFGLYQHTEGALQFVGWWTSSSAEDSATFSDDPVDRLAAYIADVGYDGDELCFFDDESRDAYDAATAYLEDIAIWQP